MLRRKAKDRKCDYLELRFGEGAVRGRALEYAGIKNTLRVMKDHRCVSESDSEFIMETKTLSPIP